MMSDQYHVSAGNNLILRRDFIQGVAIGLGSLVAGCHGHLAKKPEKLKILNEDSERRGVGGQSLPESVRGHFVRDGKHLSSDFRSLRPLASEEDYDLIVVGAGATGIAAACRFRELKGPKAKILIIENSAEPGGHARRNTFMYQGKPYIAGGGAYAIEDYEESPAETHELFRFIGLDADRLKGLRDNHLYAQFGLSTAVLNDPKVTGASSLEWLNGFYDKPYEELFGQSSLSKASKKELIQLYTTRENHLKHENDVGQILKNYSWKKFIKEKMGLGDLSVSFANMYSSDLLGLGADSVSSELAKDIGPGFYGMGGEGFTDKKGVLTYGYEPGHRFPDGTYTLIKMMLKKLNPFLLTGNEDMEGVFSGNWNYDEFDNSRHTVRLRMSSLVTQVRHTQTKKKVTVEYMNGDGTVHLASAKSVIVSSWGCLSKHIIPELSDTQRMSFDQYKYTSALYINVLLNNWRPFLNIGSHRFFLPDGYCSWMHLSDPLRIGDYQPNYHPDHPTILSMYKYLYYPDMEFQDQMKFGRANLLVKSFAAYEKEIRSELNRILGPWGFNDKRDISGIMINRWAHGYNFFNHPSQSDHSYINARKSLGRISFAGTDSGGEAWLQAGISQAYRAVAEQTSCQES